MQTRWFKGLNEQEVKDLRTSLLASELVFKRLGQLIREDLLVSEQGAQYGSPSWAYEQADQLGQQRAFNKVLRLISSKESKK